MTLVKGSLPKLLKRNAYDLLMFGYVKALQQVFPSISVEKAVMKFAEEFDIVEGFNIGSARTAFIRMNEELRDANKTTS